MTSANNDSAQKPKNKKRLLDFWDMPLGGMLVVSRKDDWRLHAVFTKEEIDEFIAFLKVRGFVA